MLVENELKKLEKFDGVYFRGKNVFEEDGRQSYLVLQLMEKYLETANNNVKLWKSKELSDEKISYITGFEYPSLRYYNDIINVTFDGSVLK